MKSTIERFSKVLSCGIPTATMILTLSGCAVTSTIEENPAVAELAPMSKPVIANNSRDIFLDKQTGEERFNEYLAVREDGSHSGKSSTGCGWESLGEYVSPSISWTKCSNDPDWHSGENQSIEMKGELWPLRVGNKASFTYTQFNAHGKNNGRKTRKCEVTDTVNIDVVSGNLDTYKVVCTRRDNNWSQSQIFYFSPKLKTVVKRVRKSSSDGLELDYEYLRTENI